MIVKKHMVTDKSLHGINELKLEVNTEIDYMVTQERKLLCYVPTMSVVELELGHRFFASLFFRWDTVFTNRLYTMPSM
jgi:hypothetical protein